jgi:hypothetical protein
MLNVPRFQLALNSDDPDIVKLGLRQFLQQVLSENDALMTFGVDGIPLDSGSPFGQILHPPLPPRINGLEII